MEFSKHYYEFMTENIKPVKALKVADRVEYNGTEMLVSVVLNDKVLLRKPNSLTNSGRLLFVNADGEDNTVTVK